MLTVTRISPGSGVAYLTRQVANGRHDFRPAGPGSFVAYHADPAAHGEAPGWWAGASDTLFGATGMVTDEQLQRLIGEGRHPVSGAQLGRLWRTFAALDDDARKAAVEKAWQQLPPDATYEQIAQVWLRIWTAPERHAVAGFDVTVSPVKSVSLLWAFGDDRVKQQVMAAHHDGVRAALAHLRAHGAFTRLGTNGIVQVDTDGLAAMVFDHRMSREQDPQLHAHIVVSAKVRISRDGRITWLALDSRAFYQATIGARVAYERAVEHQLSRRLAVRFAARAGSPIREIAGFDPRALMHYAKRRTAVEAELDTRHTDPGGGREWIPVGRWRRSAQDATLRTRQPKAGVESTNDAVARWLREDRQAGLDTVTEVRQIVTGRAPDPVAQQARQVIRQARRRAAGRALRAEDLDTAAIGLGLADDRREAVVTAAVRRVPHLAVERAIAEVSADRAVFTIDHLELAIGRHLHVDPSTDRAADWQRVQRYAARAIRTRLGGLRVLTPPALVDWSATLLRGSDRQSIYSRHRDLKLSTEPILAAEKELLAYATRTAATPAPRALLDEVADRLELSDEKRAGLHFAVGDGRRVTGIVGPAGTGKTYLQRAVGVAARQAGIPVVGLTVGQNAAFVLADATRDGDQPGIRTENIAMWLHAQHHPPDGTTTANDWAFAPGQWVIIDEASQASTHDLVRLTQLLEPVGGKLILVGDPEQISAIGPGGMFRYLASLGVTTQLTEVRRFTEAWEGPASLRLRDGDTTVLAEYDRRGRILAGHRAQLIEHVLDGWTADVLNGRTSLILVETEAEAADIATQARRLLIRAGLVQPGRTVTLADGTHAGPGDLVVSRRNNRALAAGDMFVANRAQWRILELGPDGDLLAENSRSREHLTLPAGYVAEHVQLAYAATVDSAQGRTVDVGRAIIDSATSRARLYVMATRGRLANILAVVTADHPPEAHPPAPPTAGITVLAGILRDDDTDRSATETEQTLWADADALRHWGPIYDDLVGRATTGRYVDVIRTAAGRTVADNLAADPAMSVLAARLQALAAAGHDPEQALAAVASARELHTARDTAAVLAWRLDDAYGDLRPDPAVALDPAQAGTYTQRMPAADGDIGAALRQVAAICDSRIDALARKAAAEQPAWTRPLGPPPADVPGRRQWEGRAAVVAAYRDRYPHPGDDPIAPEPPHRDIGRWGAWHRAHTVLGVATLAGQLHAATDTQLHALVAAQRDADQQAPPYVAGQLRVAHTQLVTAEHQLRDTRLDLATAGTTAAVALRHADAQTPRWWHAGAARTRAAIRHHQATTDALRATTTVDELQSRLAGAQARVSGARDQVRVLEAQHQTWARWYSTALPTRYAGLAAAAETGRRAHQIAGITREVTAAVGQITAKVRAVDATRPQLHHQPVPDRLADRAADAYERITEHSEPAAGHDLDIEAGHA